MGGSTWLGDGFQLAFGVNGKYAYELCLALTNEGPQLYALWTISGETGLVKGAKVAAKRAGKHTYYETAIPWTALKPLAGQPGKDVAFNFILNENDGTNKRRLSRMPTRNWQRKIPRGLVSVAIRKLKSFWILDFGF